MAVVILMSYLILHLPTINIYQRMPSRTLIAHTIVLVLVVPSPTFRNCWILLFSVWQNPDFFRSTDVNEANDNLIIERSDEILEDTNEKYFMICTLFQTPKFLVEYVTGWQCFNWFGNFNVCWKSLKYLLYHLSAQLKRCLSCILKWGPVHPS